MRATRDENVAALPLSRGRRIEAAFGHFDVTLPLPKLQLSKNGIVSTQQQVTLFHCKIFPKCVFMDIEFDAFPKHTEISRQPWHTA
jgi:hypothetical protein